MVPGARPSSDECLFSIWFLLCKDTVRVHMVSAIQRRCVEMLAWN